MQGHYAAEVITALVVCIGIAVALVLIMLAALLINGSPAQRRKWIPRYIMINSGLAVLFCGFMIFTQSRSTYLSVGKLAIVVLVVTLWAVAAAGRKYCEKCGERLINDISGGLTTSWNSKKICPSCPKA